MTSSAAQRRAVPCATLRCGALPCFAVLRTFQVNTKVPGQVPGYEPGYVRTSVHSITTKAHPLSSAAHCSAVPCRAVPCLALLSLSLILHDNVGKESWREPACPRAFCTAFLARLFLPFCFYGPFFILYCNEYSRSLTLYQGIRVCCHGQYYQGNSRRF